MVEDGVEQARARVRALNCSGLGASGFITEREARVVELDTLRLAFARAVHNLIVDPEFCIPSATSSTGGCEPYGTAEAQECGVCIPAWLRRPREDGETYPGEEGG